MSNLQLFDLDFQSVARAINLLDPVNPQDVATRAYVDANIEGLAWKDNCRVASTVNLTLSAPGASIDGITMNVGDRFLAKNQSTASENGIYVWNGAAVAATRALDANTGAELLSAITSITDGSANIGTTWRQTAVNITIGVTSIAWASFGTVAPPASETVAGIIEIATQAETDAGVDDARAITPLKLANWSGRPKRYATSIGDGTSTQLDVTHNLGTKDVVVSVRRNSDDRYVNVNVISLSTTVVRLQFAVAPAVNAIRVVVLA